MRPRAIQSVPGLNPDATPFERLREFARMIVSVPESEIGGKTKKKPGSAKRSVKAKRIEETKCQQ
jgi:hypothetical protein